MARVNETVAHELRHTIMRHANPENKEPVPDLHWLWR